MMTSLEMAQEIVKTLDDKKASDITLLEIEKLTVLADYFVICTGTSTTHIRAMSDEVERALAAREITAHHVEGYLSGGWVLMDFGGVVVHLFLKDMREFYMLERMWSDAKRVDISGLVSPNQSIHGSLVR
jgi:ribosome-associated protein